MGAALCSTTLACSTKREAIPARTSQETSPILAADAGLPPSPSPDAPSKSRVAVVHTSDRRDGVSRGIALLGLSSLESRSVFLKPNLNSSDLGPASTHEETLLAVIDALRDKNAGRMVLGDRSGMGNTREVLEARGLFKLGEKLDFQTIAFDELDASQWRHMTSPQSSWKHGVYMPTPFLDADFKVMMCCLKTHRYGGHFTLTLKNSVGLAAKKVPGLAHDFMRELHSSPHQRTLIAELNALFTPDLIVLDGVEAFVDGGPAQGDLARGEMMLVGTDRVAMDMLGVAMLRELGTNDDVATGAITDLEQIARAIELDIGTHQATELEILTDDAPSHKLAERLLARL